MLINYFKVAWRNLLRSKGYSSINVIGLGAGMAIALIIGLWIWDEVSFNRYHIHYDRLARIMTTQTFNNETNTAHTIVVPLEKELRTKYGNNFKRLSLTWTSTNILAAGDKKISSRGKWAQPDFPEMFSLKMINGSSTSFNDPSTMLVSQSLANSLFGDSNPVGKILKIDNKTDVKIGGVYEDLP